jgi:hypothetical protein
MSNNIAKHIKVMHATETAPDVRQPENNNVEQN